MVGPEDIAPIGVHDYLRREQRRFFRGGVYDPAEVASLIVLEALLLGSSDVRVVRERGWFRVFSTTDWIAALGENVFRQLVPIRRGGQNSVTAEILAVVFAKSVVTVRNGEVEIVKGDSLGPLAGDMSKIGREVAFDAAIE